MKAPHDERRVICQWCLHRVMEYERPRGRVVWRCTNCGAETPPRKKRMTLTERRAKQEMAT
jgi:DNA-directed RNA polymerase subunit RPC12/RpoP